MSDPAVEAAHRHLDTLPRFGGHSQLQLLATDLVDAAREMAAPIIDKHKPLVIQCLAPNCGAELCDHEVECPADYPVTVCAECWQIVELAHSYYGEEGIDDRLLWPCETARRVYSTEELSS